MNFLTGKRVSRRQVLRGVGAGLALPMLDAMVPAARAVAQEIGGPEALRRGVHPARRAARLLEPGDGRRGLRAFRHLAAARAASRRADRRLAARESHLGARRHRCLVALGHRAETHRRRGRARRENNRSSHRGQDRYRHRLQVDRGRDGGLHGLHRRLRPGVCVRLLQHARVALGDRAAADGDQSAQSVRTPVRPAGHGGAEARADADGPQHPRLRPRGSGAAATRRRRFGSLAARRLPRSCARDRGANRARGASRPAPTRTFPTRRSAFRTRSRSTSSCSSS